MWLKQWKFLDMQLEGHNKTMVWLLKHPNGRGWLKSRGSKVIIMHKKSLEKLHNENPCLPTSIDGIE